MKAPETEEETPYWVVTARAVAAWPDTSCVQGQISLMQETAPVQEDLDTFLQGIVDAYTNALGEEPGRTSVVFQPYCSSDEDEAPPYDPDEDPDLDHDDLQDLEDEG